jgi:DNA-binding protein H-NS
MAINIDALSHAELQALIESAEAQMSSARKNHVLEVRAKMDALLQNAGLTLDEVYPRRGGKAPTGTKSIVAPKYRNPDNAAQTWSGRGKRPLWFVGALKKRGVTAESMLIEGTKAATVKGAKAVKKAPAKKARAKK